MNMRYIIAESRLDEIFEKYMESTYDLRYYHATREFRVKERLGEIFGDLWEQRFYYSYRSDEELLKGMFGNVTNKLLLSYLRKKFPKEGIMGIENDPVEVMDK